MPTAGDVIRNIDIVCYLGERLGDVTDRVRAYGRDASIVVNNYHVVFGRLQGGALQGNPDAAVEDIMHLGPSTVRQDTPLETVVKTLRDSNANSTLVTGPAGRLTGVHYLEDAVRKLEVDVQQTPLLDLCSRLKLQR